MKASFAPERTTVYFSSSSFRFFYRVSGIGQKNVQSNQPSEDYIIYDPRPATKWREFVRCVIVAHGILVCQPPIGDVGGASAPTATYSQYSLSG